MKIKVRKQIGTSTFEFEVQEDKDIDALFTAGIVASTPAVCGLCKSKNVQLVGNKAKGYTFVKVSCLDCGGQSQLGSYKDGGYFWKKFEIYQKEGNKPDFEKDASGIEKETKKGEQTTDKEGEVNGEDIPF